MKKAALYARVSTTQQAEKELSIPAQIEEMKKYAKDKGYMVVEIYKDEGYTGTTVERPAFQKMIMDAKKTPKLFDMILVHKNNRFSRSLKDATFYKHFFRKKRGIELISVVDNFDALDNPEAQLMEGIMDTFDQYFSMNLAKEVKKGMQQKAKQGKVLGEVPLGYKSTQDGSYQIVDEEAEVVKYIFDQYIRSNKGLRAIALDLQENGQRLFGDAGNKYKWSGSGIRVILTNNIYQGKIIWNKRDTSSKRKIRPQKDWIVKTNQELAIIDQDTFEKAQKILRDKRTHRSNSKEYLLKGIVKCLDCGGNMSQHTQRWKNKKGNVINRQLRCSNYIHKSICYYNHIKLDEIDKIVIQHLKKVINSVKIDENVNIINSNTEEIAKDLKKIKNDLKTFDKKFERQMMAYEDGLITIEELRKFRERLDNEKKELKAKILKKEKDLDNNNIEYDELKRTLENAVEVLEGNYNMHDKHRIIKTIIKEIRFSLKNKEVQIDLIY